MSKCLQKAKANHVNTFWILITPFAFDAIQKVGTTGITENQAKMPIESTLRAYQNEPKTQEMILAEKDLKDYRENVEFN